MTVQPLAACLQLNSQQDIAANLATVTALGERAVSEQGAQLLVLPENAFCHPFDTQFANQLAGVLPRLQALAQKLKIWLCAGSIPLAANLTAGDEKYFSALHVINPAGEIAARYHKLHLFDVHVAEENHDYRESDTFAAGDKPALVQTPWGNIGLAICYDLRFPELFRAFETLPAEQQPFAWVTPSAFTWHTGSKHWHHLLSARAVDNFAWILAANQCGYHPGGRRTFGHSAIVDPDGRVVAELADGVGYICHRLDPAHSFKLRKQIPVAQHRRF